MGNQLVAADFESAHVHRASRIAVPIGDVHPEIRAGRSGLFRRQHGRWCALWSLGQEGLSHCAWHRLARHDCAKRTPTCDGTNIGANSRSSGQSAYTGADSNQAHPTCAECELRRRRQSADPVSAFVRLNVGRIPLTSAELIRALVLRSDRPPRRFRNDERANATIFVRIADRLLVPEVVALPVCDECLELRATAVVRRERKRRKMIGST